MKADGVAEIAGAILRPDSLAHAELGSAPARRPRDNDGHGFFAALGNAS
jgi:glycerate-2-kinase